jgi:hypothetical protein
MRHARCDAAAMLPINAPATLLALLLPPLVLELAAMVEADEGPSAPPARGSTGG